MVGSAREAYGGVDVLVNNAGILGGESVVDMPLERWNRQLAVNLTGTFLCTKHVARLMIEQGRGGSIIVIVSTAGHQGQPGNIGYCTSKSGLLNFTRAAAMDLAKHKIRVNSLTPTATDVEESVERAVEWGRARPAARGRLLDFAKMVPAGELPSPRHYARAAVVPRVGRRRDDHRLRSARRRRAPSRSTGPGSRTPSTMRLARMIQAVDAHAAGEPGRVIVGGVLDVPGATMFEKMRHLATHGDGLRRCMLREPRGYPGANCNVILPPTHPEADAGFVIMEHVEYPGMSGTNTICVVDRAPRDRHGADAGARHRAHAGGAGGTDPRARRVRGRQGASASRSRTSPRSRSSRSHDRGAAARHRHGRRRVRRDVLRDRGRARASGCAHAGRGPRHRPRSPR